MKLSKSANLLNLVSVCSSHEAYLKNKMQPMVSGIDHESRHSLYNQQSNIEGPSESTPLITRIPQDSTQNNHDTATAVTIGILLIILLSGIVIGSYLLIEQGHEENVLPPVEMAVQLVSRTQWDPGYKPNYDGTTLSAPRSRHVLAMQTDTDECWTVHDCQKLLLNGAGTAALNNFLVTSSGHTFEVLGWRQQSPLTSSGNYTALVLGFIGNFTEKSPSDLQIEEAKRFFDESVSQQFLHPLFTIMGQATNGSGTYLFRSLQKLPHWGKMLSDT